MTYAHRAQAIADVATSADVLFAYLDDQASLGSHMQKPSMMMLGGRMSYEFDEARGRAVGSVVKMRGTILGLVLSVEEVIIDRQPSRRKVWETRGPPNLLVIGGYRMGFEMSTSGAHRDCACSLTTAIQRRSRASSSAPCLARSTHAGA